MRAVFNNYKFKGVRQANFIPFKNLSRYMKKVDIGDWHDVSQLLPVSYQPEEPGEVLRGVYRNLRTYVPRLAEFYLKMNRHRTDKLKQFEYFDSEKKNPDSFMFIVTFGGDGAPGIGTTFDVSFVNVGKRIYSSKSQHLVFGSDVSETHEIVDIYVRRAAQDFEFLESKVFEVEVDGTIIPVEFKVQELPNDMKMLCFLGGEVSNNATYFTTFADVSIADSTTIEKSFDKHWKPVTWQKRKEEGTKAEKHYETLKKTKKECTLSYVRSLFTKWLAKNNSRQEMIPRVGRFITFAKADPLHMKNNICCDYFDRLWRLLFSCITQLCSKKFAELPKDDFLVLFVNFIKKDMNCNALGKKIKTWHNESRVNAKKFEPTFTYRFRGQESNAFLRLFPKVFRKFYYLVRGDQKKEVKFLQIYFHLILLRKLVSYSARLEDFTLEDAKDMKNVGRKLFVAAARHHNKISPSLWVLSNCAPVHAAETLRNYGFGLGVTSMEAREQNHQRVKSYMHNTTPQDKWQMVMRHDFLSNIYIPEYEKHCDAKTYTPKHCRYIPDPPEGSCDNCGLKLEQNEAECIFCDNLLYKEIEQKITDLC